MKKSFGQVSIKLISAIVIAILVALYVIGSYNSLVSQNQNVLSFWAQVQNQYQRRMDLIPNLVNTVKGEANFEKSTLTDVINARAKATQVTLSPEIINDQAKMNQFQQAQGQLGSSLSRLMVSVEKYPDLKSNQQFAQLMDEVAGTENRIAVSRRDFNNVVQTYNTTLLGFPKNIIAGMFGYKTKAYFQADQGAEKAPVVSF